MWMLILYLIGLMQAARVARAGEPEAKAGSDRIEKLKQVLAQQDEKAQLAPVWVPKDILDQESGKAMNRALTAYYDYRTQGYEHRRRVFSWQLLSSKIIFILVIFLVGIGVFFSWLQFRRGLENGGQKDAASAATTFEASPGGVKVSSPVLGVIILAMSLVFFYLYLVYVFPIEEIL